ncbi:MAG: hypothetical protein ACPGED_06860 [Flavobacteriales bacterium]
MKYTLLTSFLFLFLSTSLLAQSTLFERDVDQARRQKQTGKNTEKHTGVVLSYGRIMPIAEADSGKVDLRSSMLSYGFYGKRKINNTFSYGWVVEYSRMSYSIEQDTLENKFTPGVEHEKDRFNWNLFGGGAFFRTNFGKRGNVHGKHLDIGANVMYGFAVKRIISRKDDPSMALGSEQQDYVYKRLKFINRLQYDAFARIGLGDFGVFGRYRLSDLWKSHESVNNNQPFPELSRLTIGIDLRI